MGNANSQTVRTDSVSEIEHQIFISLADNSNEFFGISNLSMKPIYVNPAGLRVVGIESIEQAGEVSVLDFFFPEDRDYLENEFFPSVLRDGQGEIEIRFRHFRTGEALWMIYMVFLVKDKDGAPFGYGTISRDITERKRMEEALQKSERQYRSLFNSIEEAFCLVEVLFDEAGGAFDYRFLEVNPAFEKITELKDAAGRTARELVPNLEPDWAETLGRVVESQKSERFVKRSGATGFWFDLYAFPVEDPEKKRVALLFENITERKQVEEELRRLSRRNRNILESITDAFFALDNEGRFAYVNQQAERMFNREPGDLIGKMLWGEFPGLAGTEFETAYRRAMNERVSSTVTAFYPAYRRWYEAHVYPTSNGITIYFRDISESRRTEEALRQSREESERQRRLYDTILSSTPDLTYVFDLDHRFTYANKVLLEMWGKTWDEAIGKNCLDLGYEPWHAEMHDREIEQVIATRQPIRGEVPFTGTFGRRIYDYIFVPIFGTGGEVEAVAGTTRDITELKQVELRTRFIMQLDEAVRPLETPEEITQTLARLLGEHLAADRCAYAEVETDENHFYIPGDYTRGDTASIVGRYAMESFGAEVLRLMRENKPYVVHDVDNDPQVSEDDLAAYRQTEIQAVICVPLHKNGRFAACMAVHQKEPRRWTNEEIELVSFVSHRFWESIERARVVKSLNESLAREQEARRSAETANRIKDEFLATLSHELRTPLNAVLGWSSMLRSGRLGAEDTARALETVERSARAQSQLIDDLLDISRIITGKLRLEVTKIDLVRVIEGAIDAVRPAAQAKEIQIETDVDPAVGAITGDADRLQQVVWNLLSNAVKFTPEKGRVQVSLERVDSHIQITVNDTGKGIAPEFLPFIFDRFRQADQTTTRRQGGLGLGLSIVRQLVELHGGRVRAESAGAGRGASFIVRLPTAIAASESVGEEQIRAARAEKEQIEMPCEHDLGGLRILVVDDEADSRRLVCVVLEQCGAEVVTAGSAAEALSELQNASFDVLVSDVGMPEVDGYMLIGRVRALPGEKGGRVPAIALTAYARVEDRVRALSAGFQSHLSKPIEPVELIAVVASLAKGFAGK
jgi:PAS domain S-box-containing protein